MAFAIDKLVKFLGCPSRIHQQEGGQQLIFHAREKEVQPHPLPEKFQISNLKTTNLSVSACLHSILLHPSQTVTPQNQWHNLLKVHHQMCPKLKRRGFLGRLSKKISNTKTVTWLQPFHSKKGVTVLHSGWSLYLFQRSHSACSSAGAVDYVDSSFLQNVTG